MNDLMRIRVIIKRDMEKDELTYDIATWALEFYITHYLYLYILHITDCDLTTTGFV